ncbi:MAG: hypothetical protein L3J13_01545 [Devosiaceae bacterium]|nr:hypothetical protein [Devosiaceae bacterium]
MSNYKKQIKTIIVWVLLGLVVLLWVQFILFPKHQSNDIQAVTAPPIQLTDTTQTPKLSSYHLFGSSSMTEIPLDMLQGESSLDLIITGIFAYITIGGMLGPLRLILFSPLTLGLGNYGLETQSVGAILSGLTGIPVPPPEQLHWWCWPGGCWSIRSSIRVSAVRYRIWSPVSASG